MNYLNKIRLAAGLPINAADEGTKKEIVTEAKQSSAIEHFWVVVDPTKDSEIGDILWKDTPQKYSQSAVLGGHQSREYFEKHYSNVAFYVKETPAKKDAKERIAKRDGTLTESCGRPHSEDEEYGYEDEENAATFTKGQIVMYKGEQYCVEVPDAQSDFVGIIPCELKDASDEKRNSAVDLVHASNISKMEDEEVEVQADMAPDAGETEITLNFEGIKVGSYVEYQPMHGNQPRGKSKNVRITKVLGDDKYEIVSGKIIKKKEILGVNLTEMDKPSNDKECKHCGNPFPKDKLADHEETCDYIIPKDLTKKDVKEASTVNGKKQTGKVWKQTSMTPAEAKAKHGKDKVRVKKGALNNGKDMVEVYVELVKEAAVNATVWDTMPEDKDESPENAPRDERTITVPAEVKKVLKTEIDELKKASAEFKSRDEARADFYNDTATALENILNCLNMGTVDEMKKAQVFMSSLMGPMVQRIPDVAYEFLVRGGEPKTLKTLFHEVKMKK